MIKVRSIIFLVLAVMVAIPAWSQTSIEWQSLGEAERKNPQAVCDRLGSDIGRTS
jgi:hypothetical protein